MLLTGGLVDPGNIAGSRLTSPDQIRSAVIQQLRSQGRDTSGVDQNMTAILQAASPYARALMDRGGLVRWNDAVQAGQNVGSGSGVNVEGMERQAYSGILGAGAGSVRERRALDTIADHAQGVGRGDTADRSRRALTVIRALQTQLQHGDSQGQRNAARQRIQEVITEFERTPGLSREERNAFLAQVTITNNTSVDDMDARAMGAHMMSTGGSGADMFRRFTQTEPNREASIYRRRFEAGARSFANRGGSMGQLFHDVKDEDSLRNNVASLAGNEAFMAGLSESQRDAVTRANRGDRGALAEIANWTQAPGRQDERARERYKKRSFWERLTSFQSEDEYANQETARGTAADRDAERADQGVEDTQRTAVGEGIGAVTDQLAEVTRNLAQVTHNLSTVAESNRVDNLLGRRPE